MIKIILKKLKIQNFKGIAELEIDFNDGINKIYGQNGSGKSTIKNAWEWVIGSNVVEFIPKINNKELNLDTMVEATLNINDYEYKFKRESKPKYSGDVRVGNNLTYYIDDIEYTAKNYLSQVASILSDNKLDNISIITDKESFNSDSTKWKWTDRRNVLMQMAGVYEKTKDIINQDKYVLIKDEIIKGHSTSDLASQFRKNKKELKDKQLQNQALIEQKQKEIDEFLGINFDDVSNKLSIAKQKLTKLNSSSVSENISDKLDDLQEQLKQKSLELSNEKLRISITTDTLNQDKLKYYAEAKSIEQHLEEIKGNEKMVCYYCHRRLPQEMVDNILANKEQYEKDYITAKSKFDDAVNAINDLTTNNKIKSLEQKISNLKDTIEKIKSDNTNNDIDSEKETLEKEILNMQLTMSRKSDLENWGKQIKDWKSKSMEYADGIVDIETKERVLEDYMREQTNIIIKTINEKFSNGVSWALYTENYNGSVDENCIAMYNNKIYYSLSAGERNICNLETLIALQNYYDINAFIISDNAEANTIPYTTDRQVIELYVKSDCTLPNCKKIKE